MANGGLGIAIGESGIGSVLTKYPLRVKRPSGAGEKTIADIKRELGI